MAQADPHSDAMLMIPPPGFKFIPRFESVCGKSGCFECFDIYCERCESKDRRIIELEMRNNDLIKYITQLQGRMFGGAGGGGAGGGPQQSSPGGFDRPSGGGGQPPSFRQAHQMAASAPPTQMQGTSNPFAYIQSPVLYDPNLSLSYVATTTFAPAPHEPGGAPAARKT